MLCDSFIQSRICQTFDFYREMRVCVCMISLYCSNDCLLEFVCVQVSCVCSHNASRGLTWMWQPPTFSLKSEILQLRLQYTTMCQNYTRANIFDLDPTFKYAPPRQIYRSSLFYKLEC